MPPGALEIEWSFVLSRLDDNQNREFGEDTIILFFLKKIQIWMNLALFVFFSGFPFCLQGQTELSFQERLAGADRKFRLPTGHFTGRLTIVSPRGKVSVMRLEIAQKQGKRLILIRSVQDDILYKILYLNEGRTIHALDVNRDLRFLYEGKDRFRTIPGTIWNHADLGPLHLERDCMPTSGKKMGQTTAVQAKILPESPFEKGVFFLKNNDQLSRVDYFAPGRTLVRTVGFSYATVLEPGSGRSIQLDHPTMMEVFELSGGMEGRFEILEMSKSTNLSDHLFDPDYLSGI